MAKDIHNVCAYTGTPKVLKSPNRYGLYILNNKYIGNPSSRTESVWQNGKYGNNWNGNVWSLQATYIHMFWPYITSLMIIVRISKPKQMAYTGKWKPASFLAKTSCKYKMIVLTTVRGGGTKSRKWHVFFYSFWWILNILQTWDASSCKTIFFIEINFSMEGLFEKITYLENCLRSVEVQTSFSPTSSKEHSIYQIELL
jgi:hypothetical protein